MSFVSLLPFTDTLSYWWNALYQEPGRTRFMIMKFIEVSAFLDNYFLNRCNNSSSAVSTEVTFASLRAPVQLPASPVVAVVVPTLCRDEIERRRLDALLSALDAQSYGCTTIIVDDGSPVPVKARSAEVLRFPINKGPAAARNHGIAYALDRGADIVALTDADCVPAPDWVASVVAGFRKNRDAHAISGATWSLDRSTFGRYHERNGTLNGRVRADRHGLLYGPTCNLSLCADLARSVSFDTSFPGAAAEDIDFCFRAIQEGWRIKHWPSAIIYHDYGYDELSPIRRVHRFWRQFRRYAKGERRLIHKHPNYYKAFEGSREIPCLPSRMHAQRGEVKP